VRIVRLGDVCDVLGGKRIPKGEKLSDAATNHPYIRVSDFDGAGGVSTSSLKYVPDKVWGQISRYTISKDDVFLSIAGTIGVTGLIPDELDGANLTENACKLVIKSDLDKKYLYYFTLSTSFRSQTVAGIKQTAQPKLALARIKDIRIPLPPLEEQRRIVARLDAAFEKISAAEVLTRQNLDNVSALQKSILHKYLSTSDTTSKLADVCQEIFAGGDVVKSRTSKTITENFTVPVYTNGEKNNGLYGFTDMVRVNKPSVTVSARGTIGFSAVRKEPFYPAVRLIVLTPDTSKLDVEYLDYAIKTLTIDNTGTSIPQLTVPMIKEYSVSLPSIDTQRKIVGILNAANEKISKLELKYTEKLTKLAGLRQSLLAEAFSTTNTV
jgi:type I restriction enzyme S subunit